MVQPFANSKLTSQASGRMALQKGAIMPDNESKRPPHVERVVSLLEANRNSHSGEGWSECITYCQRIVQESAGFDASNSKTEVRPTVRPMEESPRDGTSVLVLLRYFNRALAFEDDIFAVMHWHGGTFIISWSGDDPTDGLGLIPVGWLPLPYVSDEVPS